MHKFQTQTISTCLVLCSGTNPVLQEAFHRAKTGTGKLHLLGLVSDGGVHSHIEHLKQLIMEAKKAGVPHTYVHFFADGRGTVLILNVRLLIFREARLTSLFDVPDTPPSSSVKYLEELLQFLAQVQYGAVGTVIGRYYAMDRDKRWERSQLAYEALVAGTGQATSTATVVDAVKARFAAGETDEFLKPLIVEKNGTVGNEDVMLFFDFRSDRMRQIVEVFGIKPPFATNVALPKDLHIVQMTQYNASFNMPIIFAPQSNANVLAEWLSVHGVRQFHTAETEKYAHVTFFFNGGTEAAFPLEDRALVPSPKVATYDLAPEMSMSGVAEYVAKAVADKDKDYAFVMCNLASPDMVGHTGKMAETVRAVEATDRAIGAIKDACDKNGFVLVVTADHGNAEEMLDEKKEPKTSHTSNPVFLLISDPAIKFTQKDGGLADVAPTILAIMGLPVPAEMTGKPLVQPTA